MRKRVTLAGLQVDAELAGLLNKEVLPRLKLTTAQFWEGVARLFTNFSERNGQLLRARDVMQRQIDDFHRRHGPGAPDPAAYRRFLEEIGYLLPQGPAFTLETEGVDAEIAHIAGPQLVVPIKNARFALNACNARWGSLYDALYGTDVIVESDGAGRQGAYNPVRGARVIAFARDFLDRIFPLGEGSHARAGHYAIVDGQLRIDSDGTNTGLRNPAQLAGYRGAVSTPEAVLLVNHGLHVEIRIDRDTDIGRDDAAGISDILMEAAITTIQDCEDSVAAVDAEDKVAVYRNWLGLMLGTLTESFDKDGTRVERVLAPDRDFLNPRGEPFTLAGRSLLLIRNVGHLMRTDAILDASGEEVYEGILDAIVTGAIGALDLSSHSPLRNSRSGSVYIVKPKLHGPEEAQFTCDLFTGIEKLLALAPNTLKIGIMDEERRTTLNLRECIRSARTRLFFINTGFLDRTGDEIHTAMEAGPVVSKAAMKHSAWIQAYEDNNVQQALACGLRGRAQIGKGMWAMPDRMAAMLAEKVAHPQAGASTAWVPSPTAAVLHALHYHAVDVSQCQSARSDEEPVAVTRLLTLPLLDADHGLTEADIQRELDNNIQGILGYVVRWIDQGVGCSKVADINDIGLMEDRATLRISSQHIANWLRHGLCSEEQVHRTLLRMAAVVDRQNAGDPLYRPLASDPGDSLALQAATALILSGREQPNGYTEPLLHEFRRRAKASRAAP